MLVTLFKLAYFSRVIGSRAKNSYETGMAILTLFIYKINHKQLVFSSTLERWKSCQVDVWRAQGHHHNSSNEPMNAKLSRTFLATANFAGLLHCSNEYLFELIAVSCNSFGRVSISSVIQLYVEACCTLISVCSLLYLVRWTVNGTNIQLHGRYCYY